MLLSDVIEQIILEELQSAGGTLELQRKELASRVGCVPSQINYVIASRFTPAGGYQVESRRGGGGYVRITKVRLDRNEYLMHCFHAVGEEIDRGSAEAVLRNFEDYGILSEEEALLLRAAMSEGALAGARPEERNFLRATLLRQFILTLSGYHRGRNQNGGHV